MKDFIPGFPDEVTGRDPLGAAGAFGTKPPGKGEKSESWSPGKDGLCVRSGPSPLLKSHLRTLILQQLSMEDLGEQENRTFGARMRRAFIPAHPRRWAAGKARVWGVPTQGDTQEHPRPDWGPEGTHGRGERPRVLSELRGAGFNFSPSPPGRERGAPA